MKIALTGAGGGLGRTFLSRAAAGHDVIPLAHQDLAVEDLDAVRTAMRAVRPDLIVHAAAVTSVDGCEQDPRRAYLSNALGTRNVALAAKEEHALLIALSTDYVFDGEKGEAYHEFDAPGPLSVYGRSKLAGEREATHAPEHLIVRTSWVFGGGEDFLSGALDRLARGERVAAIADLAASPTFVGHLAERLLPLAEAGHRGVVHVAGPRAVSWFALLTEAVDRFGLPGEVAPQKAEELARPAPRPRNSALTSLVLAGSEVGEMPSPLEGVAEVLEGLRGHA